MKEEVSKETAEHVRNGILATIKDLAEMPQKHGIVHEISDEQTIFRRALKWSYKIIFNIHEAKLMVRVVEIIHTKRHPDVLIEKFG
ncbi:MAG: hypothetical protein AAF849_16845 [Bacteroidota bacterium]